MSIYNSFVISKVPKSTEPDIKQVPNLRPRGTPYEISSGHVQLCADKDQNCLYYLIDIKEKRQEERFTLGGEWVNDKATYVVFNLPLNTVVTLMGDYKPQFDNPADLSGCGVCVDLIGTGKTQGVFLPEAGANDCISAYFWREVDMAAGALELFEGEGFTGARSVIFFSEWPKGKRHSIADWYLHDKVSSLRWTSLDDKEFVTLFEHAPDRRDGNAFNDICGWSSKKEDLNLERADFNDKMSSFLWDNAVPVREEIASFNINATMNDASKGLFQRAEGKNDSNEIQTHTVTLQQQINKQVTVTTSDSFVVGFKITATSSATANGGPVQATQSLSVELTTERTTTLAKETSNSLETTVNVSHQFTIPKQCNWNATLRCELAEIRETTFTTKAKRWYAMKLPGSVADSLYPGWYLREEDITGVISGGFAGNTHADLIATPLPPTT